MKSVIRSCNQHQKIHSEPPEKDTVLIKDTIYKGVVCSFFAQITTLPIHVVVFSVFTNSEKRRP